MRLNSQTGIEGSPVSSLNCDRPLHSKCRVSSHCFLRITTPLCCTQYTDDAALCQKQFSPTVVTSHHTCYSTLIQDDTIKHARFNFLKWSSFWPTLYKVYVTRIVIYDYFLTSIVMKFAGYVA